MSSASISDATAAVQALSVSSPAPAVSDASPSPAAAAASSSSPEPAAVASSVKEQVASSAQRYRIPDDYDLSRIPNPFAHVKAATIVPRVFDTPRKVVNHQDGWDYYRRIGSPKTVCAPMVNQSELAFRILCRRYSTDVCFTPMYHAGIFSTDISYRSEATIQPTSPAADRPVVYQFCGHDPQTILNAAKIVEAGGYADSIDLNCGCPQGIAKRGFYGAFLLEHTQLLHDIVSTLHQHLSIPITVKIRRLPRDEDTIALVKMLAEAGAYTITIHGRTRFQLKEKVGQVDWDIIRAIKQNCPVPVFANGGIYDREDVDACLKYTGVDGVMSSEALLCNPSLFAGKRVDALAMAREYMDIVHELEQQPVPAVTEQSMIRAHLFKILFRHLSAYTDLRDKLSTCPPDQFEPILAEINSRFAAMTPEEAQKKLDSFPYWYNRHWLTPTQLEEHERRRKEKERERAEREAAMDDCAGFCLFEEQ